MGKCVKLTPPPALFARYCASGLFSLPKGEVRASWPLIIPAKSWDEPLGGYMVDGQLQKQHLLQQ
jgi:hypothetical protein